MHRLPLKSLVATAILAATGLAAACGGRVESADTPRPAPVTQLAAENVATVQTGTIVGGPAISGQLTPAREAAVRAQIGGSLVQLTVDRGQPVRAGEEIARISSRDLQSAFESAKTGVRSSEAALGVAQSELQRTEALVRGGALAARDAEQARNAVAGAEAQLAAARARQTSVEQQLADTIVRAPFAGIVSERPASAGDILSPGTLILTIIDPSSLRLEAQVPSDTLQQIRPGAKVTFRLRGVPGTSVGHVDRFSASADPVTRQVSLFVTLPNTGGRLMAGLFAEGRIETVTRTGLVVPMSAVDETGPQPTVTRVRDGKAERVTVTLGARQPDTEVTEVTQGLSAGDVVVVGSSKAMPTGTLVKVVQ